MSEIPRLPNFNHKELIMRVIKPHRFNGYLAQCIISKFGSQRAYADKLQETTGVRVHNSLVSRVVNYHENLPPDQQKIWADALGETVENLFK